MANEEQRTQVWAAQASVTEASDKLDHALTRAGLDDAERAKLMVAAGELRGVWRSLQARLDTLSGKVVSHGR